MINRILQSSLALCTSLQVSRGTVNTLISLEAFKLHNCSRQPCYRSKPLFDLSFLLYGGWTNVSGARRIAPFFCESYFVFVLLIFDHPF
ncbi:expressed protein [Phakopsora pachyrhizi]|uniref:Expressed protein n=1 Tax=Phakopsora pachyrhizi TaxID=170000 RepID=A0AAV0AYA5_PHAPC|nr:expressed protein [Phakopsora pachyrhizi]